jgi:hypothetical protein
MRASIAVASKLCRYGMRAFLVSTAWWIGPARAGSFPAVIDLSTIDGTNGFRLAGVAEFDQLGRSVAAAGDLNGDGIGDLIVGAPGAGSSYVVFGRTDFPNPFPVSGLNGNNGFRLDGGGGNGVAVAGGGDVNGDGFADLVVGAPLDAYTGEHAGSTYIVFGAQGSFPASVDLALLTKPTGFRQDGGPGDASGSAVTDAADLNNDGIADVVIGAPFDGKHSGSAYVVFGRTAGYGAPKRLKRLSGANGFRLKDGIRKADAGSSVASAGDVNHDGIDDVILGAPGEFESKKTGSTYVVFGTTAGRPSEIDLGGLDGNNGFRIDGVHAGDGSGFSVAGAGDVNHDGIADLIVGAPYADPNGSMSGAGFVIFGKNPPFLATFSLASLDGTNGFRLEGVAAHDQCGYAVAAAGDINNDGIDDVIIAASTTASGGQVIGSAYVVFGRSSGFRPVVDLTSLDGTNGFRIDGNSEQHITNVNAVAGAGDVNGDGVSDVIVGLPNAGIDGPLAGTSDVIYGRP